MTNLLECLAAKIGEKIALKLGADAAECGQLAKRAYSDNSFLLVGANGKKLEPTGLHELAGYHLPGERFPQKNSYSKRELKLGFSLWLFGKMELSESDAWSLVNSIEAVKDAGGKQVKIEVKKYTDDIMGIIQRDFPSYKDQFQDKQTITTAIKFEYAVTILKCC